MQRNAMHLSSVDNLNLNNEAKSAVYFVADFEYFLGHRQRHRDDHRAVASARIDRLA